VRSVADGVVVDLTTDPKSVKAKSFGLFVCVWLNEDQIPDSYQGSPLRGKNVYAFYAHLSKVSVRKGDRVSEGDLIGASGNSGAETEAPHLHLEFRSIPRLGLGIEGRIDPVDLLGDLIKVTTPDGLVVPVRFAAPTQPGRDVKW
jgi:murein DD-endopeptidase MepM/ murein hydrolase activator NlpD